MNQLLDNITWFTLTGPHAVYASGAKSARRYAAGFSPIVGFADPAHPDFAALAAWCEPDEHIYCPEWKGEAPAGWTIHLEKSLFRMVWEEAMPEADEFPDAIRLGPQHADQALELAQLTNPGPFGREPSSSATTSAGSKTAGWRRWPVNACTRARCARSVVFVPIPIFAVADWRVD